MGRSCCIWCRDITWRLRARLFRSAASGREGGEWGVGTEWGVERGRRLRWMWREGRRSSISLWAAGGSLQRRNWMNEWMNGWAEIFLFVYRNWNGVKWGGMCVLWCWEFWMVGIKRRVVDNTTPFNRISQSTALLNNTRNPTHNFTPWATILSLQYHSLYYIWEIIVLTENRSFYWESIHSVS